MPILLEITMSLVLGALPKAPLAARYHAHLMSSPALIAGLQGVRRRVVYVSIYELIAIAVVTVGLSRYTGQDMGHSGVMAVVSSAVAVAWNILFNTLFERWEARQAVRGRSLRRRVAHAIGFEGGLVFTLVPLFAWWFDISLGGAAHGPGPDRVFPVLHLCVQLGVRQAVRLARIGPGVCGAGRGGKVAGKIPPCPQGALQQIPCRICQAWGIQSPATTLTCSGLYCTGGPHV